MSEGNSTGQGVCDFGAQFGDPPFGECDGPLHRALQRRATDMVKLGGCELNEVFYNVDAGPAAAETDRPMCGECIPGRSGQSDEFHSCAVDEFCDDSGSCVGVRDHPLFGEVCPFDIALFDGYAGFCGPGLRCVMHRCVQCDEGATTPEGLICARGQWTYAREPSQALEAAGTAAIAAVALLLLLNLVATLLLLCRGARLDGVSGAASDNGGSTDSLAESVASSLDDKAGRRGVRSRRPRSHTRHDSSSPHAAGAPLGTNPFDVPAADEYEKH